MLTVEEIQALQHQVSTLRNEKRQLEMLLEEKVEDVPTSPRVANSQVCAMGPCAGTASTRHKSHAAYRVSHTGSFLW